MRLCDIRLHIICSSILSFCSFPWIYIGISQSNAADIPPWGFCQCCSIPEIIVLLSRRLRPMSCVDPVWINVSPQWGNYLKFVFYTAVALYRRKGLFEIVNDCGSLPFRISPSSWLCAFLLVQIPSATLVESPFLFNWHSPGSTSWRCLGLCPVSQPWWSLMIKIGLTTSCL